MQVWNRGFQLTWLGHSAFELVTASGKVLLLDPWLEGNPSCPADRAHPAQADVIAISHAHGDHASQVPQLVAALAWTLSTGLIAYFFGEAGIAYAKNLGGKGIGVVIVLAALALLYRYLWQRRHPKERDATTADVTPASTPKTA